MKSKETIMDIRGLGDDYRSSGYVWDRSHGPGTPEYRNAVEYIQRLFDEKDIEKSFFVAELLSNAFPERIEPAIMYAKLLYRAGNPEAALEKAEKKVEKRIIGPQTSAWLSLGAACSLAREDADGCIAWTRRYVDSVPTIMTVPRRTDLPLVGVINLGPQVITQPDLPKFFHFNWNFVSQLAHQVSPRYRFCSIFVDASKAGQAQASNPVPEIVLNNVVGGELLADASMMSARPSIDGGVRSSIHLKPPWKQRGTGFMRA